MLPLNEIQQRLRNAVVHGDASRVADLLVGGSDPKQRLAIHQRHYRASLVTALLTKFPATEWLVGTAYLRELAGQYVELHPPRVPCIAEYGASFPQFLATRSNAERVPYLREFAELEWHIGQVAISVDHPAIGVEALSRLDPEGLHTVSASLQPGLRYHTAFWPVDELMKLYLSDEKPARYSIAPAEIRLEIHGSRGGFEFDRLDEVEFSFRKALWEGRSIGSAAEAALDIDATFDPGRALVQLVQAGRVMDLAVFRSEG